MDLRKLLTRHRIEWRDRGNNCSKNFVNISCPMCKQDPSFHLRIHETAFWWYCLRGPTHKGRTLSYLLNKLGIENIPPEFDAAPKVWDAPEERVVRGIIGDYNGFKEASQSHEVLNYLWSRGFEYPVELVEKFNIRYALSGKWADRVLIPLTVGWTGRAMVPSLVPRYLSETDESGFLRWGKSTSALVVEGPLDALKVGAVTNDFEVIAMTGGRLSPAILTYLREKNFHSVYLVPDSDVIPTHQVYLLQELRLACMNAKTKLVSLPDGWQAQYKDLGEMTELEVRKWLYTI